MSTGKVYDNGTRRRKKSYVSDIFSSSRPSPYNLQSSRVRELRMRLNSSTENPISDGCQQIPDFGLTSLTWRTYRLTALYKFSYKIEKLKEYAQYLSSFIEREQKKNAGVLLKQEAIYRVKFSVISGIGISEADSDAVKIEIISKDAKGQLIPQCVGVLASVERNIEPWEKKSTKRQFTVLPLLLVKGSQVFIKSLVNFLETHFSCVVQPLTFSHLQLMWMAAMWAGSQSENGVCKPLYLEYSTSLQSLSVIQYSIDGKSAYDVWSRIHDPLCNQMNEDEVHKFIKCVEAHFLKLFAIDLSCLHLCIVGTNAASVRRNGAIKIMTNEAVLYVLRHLTNLAQELTIA